MSGYALPDSVAKQHLESAYTKFIICLKDPILPLLDLHQVMSNLSGRIPPCVDKGINDELRSYEKNCTSLIFPFPSLAVNIYHLFSITVETGSF